MILNQYAGGGPGNLDGVTARPDTVLQGFAFMDRDGNLQPGLIPEVKDAVGFHPSNGTVQGAPGYYPDGPKGTPPQAGAPYVDSCTFDRQNRRVTVRARTAQAGWQGQIVGSVQTFAVPVDTFENYVYKYNVTNNAGYDIRVATSGDSDIIVNGQQVPRVITIGHGQNASVYSNIMEFRTGADNHGAGFEANFSNTYDPLALSFKSQDRLSRTTEGYLMIEKLVTVSRPR